MSKKRLNWRAKPTVCFEGHDLTLPDAIIIDIDKSNRCRVCDKIRRKIALSRKKKRIAQGILPSKRNKSHLSMPLSMINKLMDLYNKYECEPRSWIKQEIKQEIEALKSKR